MRRSIFARRPTGADVPSALLKIRGGKHDDLLQGQFHPGKPRPANLLIGYAHRQQTIIYGKLAKLIGFDGVGVQMPHRLGASCSGARNGLPGLTSIVVKEDIGLPREGTRSKASPLEQARTYDRDWYGIEPPTAEALEKPTRIIATLLNENERKRQTPWRPACIDNHGGGKRRHWVLGGTRSVRLLSCCLTCLVRGQ